MGNGNSYRFEGILSKDQTGTKSPQRDLPEDQSVTVASFVLKPGERKTRLRTTQINTNMQRVMGVLKKACFILYMGLRSKKPRFKPKTGENC